MLEGSVVYFTSAASIWQLLEVATSEGDKGTKGSKKRKKGDDG
jgi:hypothetical protein